MNERSSGFAGRRRLSARLGRTMPMRASRRVHMRRRLARDQPRSSFHLFWMACDAMRYKLQTAQGNQTSELVQWYLLFDSGQARVDKHSCGADADPSRRSRAGAAARARAAATRRGRRAMMIGQHGRAPIRPGEPIRFPPATIPEVLSRADSVPDGHGCVRWTDGLASRPARPRWSRSGETETLCVATGPPHPAHGMGAGSVSVR